VIHTPIYNRQHYWLQKHHITDIPILCNCDSLHFIEWIFSTTVLFDREENYPYLYTDGNCKTTRQVFEQIEDMKIKCVSQLWFNLGVTFSLERVKLITKHFVNEWFGKVIVGQFNIL
jgi:hypothetical protein